MRFFYFYHSNCICGLSCQYRFFKKTKSVCGIKKIKIFLCFEHVLKSCRFVLILRYLVTCRHPLWKSFLSVQPLLMNKRRLLWEKTVLPYQTNVPSLSTIVFETGKALSCMKCVHHLFTFQVSIYPTWLHFKIFRCILKC